MNSTLMIMTGSTLLKDFIPNEDYRQFSFILASTDIRTLGKRNNIVDLAKDIIPPNHIAVLSIDGKDKKFKKAYYNFLRERQQRNTITFLMATLLQGEFNTVLLCSDAEYEIGYVQILKDFIEEEYPGMKCIKYKKYKKLLEKNESIVSDSVFKDLKNQVQSELDEMLKDVKAKEEKENKLIDTISELSKEQLIEMCKIRKYKKYKKCETKKELVKYVQKKIRKEHQVDSL